MQLISCIVKLQLRENVFFYSHCEREKMRELRVNVTVIKVTLSTAVGTQGVF